MTVIQMTIVKLLFILEKDNYNQVTETKYIIEFIIIIVLIFK